MLQLLVGLLLLLPIFIGDGLNRRTAQQAIMIELPIHGLVESIGKGRRLGGRGFEEKKNVVRWPFFGGHICRGHTAASPVVAPTISQQHDKRRTHRAAGGVATGAVVPHQNLRRAAPARSQPESKIKKKAAPRSAAAFEKGLTDLPVAFKRTKPTGRAGQAAEGQRPPARRLGGGPDGRAT